MSTASETKAMVAALRENAQRLGLVWTRRYGTVRSVDGLSVTVIMDGDGAGENQTNQQTGGVSGAYVTCNSLLGTLLVGARVAVDTVPNPHGGDPTGSHYIVGVIDNPSPGYRLISADKADATNDLTLGTSAANVPGCFFSLTWPIAGFARIYTVWDFQYTASGNAIAQGQLQIDGATQSEEAHLDGGGSTTIRATVPANFQVNMAAGAHTFQMQGVKSAALATIRSRITHTTLIVEKWIPDWI